LHGSGFANRQGGVDKVLLIRLDHIGDFIITSPSIRTVRDNFPSAYITLLVSPRVYPLAKLCPYVNEVLTFETNFDVKNVVQNIERILSFAKENLWEKSYDLCIYFAGLGIEGPVLRSFLPFLSGAKERVGYNYDSFCEMLHTLPVTWRPKEIPHEVPRWLYLLQECGMKLTDDYTEVWFDKSDMFKAEKLLEGFAEGRVKIAAGIGASTAARIYPPEKYLVAFKEIIEMGGAIVLFGGKYESWQAKFLEENLPAEFVKNFVEVGAGWRIDAAAMSLTDMYIGNFTGACDIAAALHKPVIALSRVAKDTAQFVTEQSTEAEMFHPWRTKSIVLQPDHQLDKCAENHLFIGCGEKMPHCIAQIEPSEIVDAYKKLLKYVRGKHYD